MNPDVPPKIKEEVDEQKKQNMEIFESFLNVLQTNPNINFTTFGVGGQNYDVLNKETQEFESRFNGFTAEIVKDKDDNT